MALFTLIVTSIEAFNMPAGTAFIPKVIKKDDEKFSNDLAKDLRFYYSKKAAFYAVDSIGKSAVKGIGSFLSCQISMIKDSDKELLGRILDNWNEV